VDIAGRRLIARARRGPTGDHGEVWQRISAGWTWTLLPRELAIHRMRRECSVGRAAAAVALCVSAVLVVAAIRNLADERSLERFTAVAVRELDDSHAVVQWQDGVELHSAEYAHPEEGLAVGDTIDVTYPAGHPELAHAPDAPDLLVAALVLVVLTASGIAFGWARRHRPRAEQLAIVAQGDAGRRVEVELRAAPDRCVVLAHDLETGTATVATVGGRDPLPSSPRTAMVRGSIATGQAVVVELDGALLNTPGRVREIELVSEL
jgi:hypothetical protein